MSTMVEWMEWMNEWVDRYYERIRVRKFVRDQTTQESFIDVLICLGIPRRGIPIPRRSNVQILGCKFLRVYWNLLALVVWLQVYDSLGIQQNIGKQTMRDLPMGWFS